MKMKRWIRRSDGVKQRYTVGKRTIHRFEVDPDKWRAEQQEKLRWAKKDEKLDLPYYNEERKQKEEKKEILDSMENKRHKFAIHELEKSGFKKEDTLPELASNKIWDTIFMNQRYHKLEEKLKNKIANKTKIQNYKKDAKYFQKYKDVSEYSIPKEVLKDYEESAFKRLPRINKILNSKGFSIPKDSGIEYTISKK